LFICELKPPICDNASAILVVEALPPNLVPHWIPSSTSAGLYTNAMQI
jgi:hypothetical protein